MSQAKVDRYKQEKKNRQQIMKKEKMKKRLWKIGGCVVGVLLIGWIGVSAFNRFYEAPRKMYVADMSALDDYMSDLNADEAEE